MVVEQQKRYQTILLDAPWPYRLRRNDKTHRNNLLKHYQDMSEADILALPVAELADSSGCALWMWTTIIAWASLCPVLSTGDLLRKQF